MNSPQKRTTLCVYDHTGGGVIPVATVQQVAEECGLVVAPQAYAPAEVVGTIGLIHPPSNDTWESVLASAGKDEIRIRMSSQGRPGSALPVKTKVGAYGFELVPKPFDLPKAHWEAILSGLSDGEIIKTLAAGGDVRDLRGFFFRDPDPQILPALTILCQGYLAAHVDPRTAKLDIAQDQPAHELCDKALERMGWKTLIRNPEVELPGMLGRDRLGLQKTLLDPTWWKIFGEDDPLKIAQQEWGRQGNGPWQHVKALITQVVGGKGDIKPEVVARAYLALAGKLGKREQ
ncbi:MAG: hypothetical protein KAY24_03530 [Candidatus Eisenbacteria sp.]|nr:hypothetical protein [Candidatus Eisenbacteria bacterium]